MLGFIHESQHNESQEWYTPKSVFDALGLEFDLDAASPGADIVPWIPAKKHLTIKENGLKTPWEGRVWLNPPYGQETPKWIKKFAAYSDGVMLVFSRTDTRWFHSHAIRCDALCFVKGRLGFTRNDGKSGKAGSGSLLLAQGCECVQALLNSNLGYCVVKSSCQSSKN